jgi:hypothetical protein
MAKKRIVVCSHIVRYPVGGYLSWILQWLVGFRRLGHDVYFAEKHGWSGSCYDPLTNTASDDCSYGTRTLRKCLARFGLEDRWCFRDAAGCYHGLSRARIEETLRSADLFIDMSMDQFMGLEATWLAEAAGAGLRVLVDGEPGFAQMKLEKGLAAGERLPQFDRYYTVGQNVGTSRSTAPTAGKSWHHVFDPVVIDLFPLRPVPTDAPFTTVMSWQAHSPMEFRGTTYGQKDVEFARFMTLPRRTSGSLEIAVAGKDVPRGRLRECGWRLLDSHEATVTFDSFRDYVSGSRGEFSVAKNVFVVTNSGFFSERSAYLASGRPVIMQDTGFSDHLPCGWGLFAVRTVEEAAAAIDEVNRDYQRHSKAARDVALEHLDTAKVLPRFLRELGV